LPQVFIVDTDGTHVRQVTHHTGGARDPTWSPDGSRIAYAAAAGTLNGKPGDTDIFVIGASGGGVRLVARTERDDRHPDWSPDGSAIAFDSGFQVWVAPLDGRRPTDITAGQGITHGHGPPSDPHWSPDGRWILVTRFDPGSMNGTYPYAHPWVMRADGSQERPLGVAKLRDNDWQLEPAWSPDGRTIVFVQGYPSKRLGFVDLATREVHYRSLPANVGDLSWGRGGIVASLGPGAVPSPSPLVSDREI
jgi:Tol biopolymer transport system component